MNNTLNQYQINHPRIPQLLWLIATEDPIVGLLFQKQKPIIDPGVH